MIIVWNQSQRKEAVYQRDTITSAMCDGQEKERSPGMSSIPLASVAASGKCKIDLVRKTTVAAGISIALLSMFVLSSCEKNRNEYEGEMKPDSLVSSAMHTVATHRIYFGHQSVGANILAGLQEIQRIQGEKIISFKNPGNVQEDSAGVFVESSIGNNAQPESKCEDFERTLRLPFGRSLDIVMMKFCYVDISAETDVNQLFGIYCRMVDSIQKAMPSVRFVHITVPLTRQTPGWKKLAKQILGKWEQNDVANVRRMEYNARLLSRFEHDPVFDLARIESTYPDGTRNQFELGGSVGCYMLDENTDDGGHLNARGRLVAAEEMVKVLAAALGARDSSMRK
jgi:hypothetical protein